MSKGKWPNFFIIGAARSGTSSLYEYMRQHPDIFLSEHKEPMYFAFKDNEPCFRGPGDDIEVNQKAVIDSSAYCDLFKGVNNEKAIGEASANYLYYECAAKNIKTSSPDAKFIALLRNPAERAYSSYLYTVRDGRETELNFELALEREDCRVEDNWCEIWHYRRMGFYSEQLKRYYDLYPSSQIKVVLLDDLKSDPEKILTEIFSFLGVDNNFLPDVTVTYNQGGQPKNRILNTFLTRPSKIKKWLRPRIPKALLHAYISLKHKNLSKPELVDRTYNQLISDYMVDMLALEKLISRDLSHWRTLRE